jgi:hypothetical protein
MRESSARAGFGIESSTPRQLQIPAYCRFSRTSKEETDETAKESEIKVVAAGKSNLQGHCEHRHDHDTCEQERSDSRPGSEKNTQAAEELYGGNSRRHESGHWDTVPRKIVRKDIKAAEKFKRAMRKKNDSNKQSQDKKRVVPPRAKDFFQHEPSDRVKENYLLGIETPALFTAS